VIDTIYIEDEVRNHPKVKAICGRFPKARLIPCARYGEIFNPKAQNFRLQKRRPALILAKKFGRFVLQAPRGYGIGGERNFYFSHMLNCMYDCRYCFLQGMYRSAHFVVFVNFEDFQTAIEEKIKESGGEESYFFSGYDCDSLALDGLTHFVDSFLPFFAGRPRAWVELRTKSVQIQALLKHNPIPNCIVAFSMTPPEIGARLEEKVPPLSKRLEAMKRLEERGWKLGLRFDPLMDHEHWKEAYQELFQEVFRKIRISSLHSVSLGPFRLPKAVYENMYRLYPDEPLLSGPLGEREGMVSYGRAVEREIVDSVTRELLRYVPKEIFFPCLVNKSDGEPISISG